MYATVRLVSHFAVALHLIAQNCLQLAGNAFVINALYGGHDAVLALVVRGGIGGSVTDGETFWCIAFQSHDDDVVGHRGKGSATIVIPFLFEGHRRECRLQVQFALVVANVFLRNAFMRHFQASQRQVLHPVRTFDKLLVDEFCSFCILVVEDEIAYFIEMVN